MAEMVILLPPLTGAVAFVYFMVKHFGGSS